MANFCILKQQIKNEDDIVIIRHRSKEIAEMLGFDQVDQIRIATAVSEIARNSLQYAGGGTIEYFIHTKEASQKLVIEIEDKGQGIEDLDLVLQGKKKSLQGLGIGISGAKKLVDDLEIHTGHNAGTKIILTKNLLSTRHFSENDISDISAKLAKTPGESSYDELMHQNEDLVNMLDFITEQKVRLEKANGELRKQALIFGTMSDAIVIADMNHKIIDINPAAEKMYGYTKEECLGKTSLELYRPYLNTEERNEIVKKILEGKTYSTELIFRNKNGVEGINLTVFTALKDEHCNPIAILAASNDITELVKSRQIAEQASKAKSEFLSSMSHELRTPMNAIIGISDLLIKSNTENLSPKQLEGIQLINKSGNRLLELINDILDLAKIESGRLEVNNTVTSINRIILDLQNIVKNLILNKNIKFWVYKDSNVPDLIYTDSKKVSQVLLNLLGNSVKFTEKGEIVLKIYSDDHKLYFEVKDTGIGIKKEDAGLLFKEFQQLETSPTKKYKGSGLGLALSKKMVELIGGKISIESEPNIGTTVTFCIPLVVLPDTTMKDIKELQIPDKSITKDKEDSTKKKAKLLIAEDDEIGRKTIEMMLEDEYKIIFAENGQEAIDKFKEENPVLVFMDIMMPVMSGYDAFKEIRKLDPEKKIPIIALTASAMKGERESIIAFGFDDYIAKPIDIKTLKAKLNQYLH